MIVAYVLLAIAILLFMVLVHEFGHYVAGKILKFKITEFSVGFGFSLFSHTSKKTGEKFSLRAFPLGGYCAFYGEDDEAESNNPQAFNNQKPWKRIIVFLAGVTANFITAIIFSWILLCTTGYDVTQIARDVTYQQNVFLENDIITHVEGKKVDFAFGGTYVNLVNSQRAKALEGYKKLAEDGADVENLPQEQLYSFEMRVVRDGNAENLTIYVYPKYDVVDGERSLNVYTGLESADNENAVTKPYVFDVWSGFCRSFGMAFGFAWVVLKSLWQLITFQIPITQMGGTISTIATIATIASQSMSYFLIFMPLIAANLAVFNVLPFPALDGSHVLFTLIEWIRGKPINRKVENMIHFVGLCILLGFVILVDILHFVL